MTVQRTYRRIVIQEIFQMGGRLYIYFHDTGDDERSGWRNQRVTCICENYVEYKQLYDKSKT